MITTIRKSPWLREILFLFIFSFIFTAFNLKTIAQIIPDNTLGAEKSRVTPSGVKDLIEGGAIRNDNLFHSFTEFNINNGQQVYFANPAGINNILTRVTGSNISRILGTLGVNGGANLFLINPNGIIFGANAKLDIAGSFTATTANSLILNNYEFSATNPTAPALLKINVTPGLQYGAIQPNRQISNQGNLSVGEDLTLVGDMLNLQGQLNAANNLTIIGNNTTIRDDTTQPFIASSGGNLLVQGQNLDIFALNHPNSGFFSGGNITLQSANPVSGDAHYTSRGNFQITSPLTGGTEGGGSLVSLYDPVIKAGGDVLIGSYIGASLHIIAAGKVEIPQFIRITGADANQGLQETITLSDNTNVAIDGKARPTLDIRAGVDPAAIGSTSLPSTGTVGFGTPRNFSNTPTSADIKVGTILFANTTNTLISGQVLLTNQYRPNPNLQGDIQINNTFGAIGISNNGLTGSRSVNIDSKGSITLNGSIDTSAIAVNNRYSDNGGDVRLLSGGNITLNNGADLASSGLLGGNITFKSNGDISLTNADVLSNSYTNVPSTTGGDITLAAKSILMNNGSNLIAQTFGQGNAGKVKVAASESIFLAEDSNIRSTVEQRASGNANGIEITAKTIELNTGSDFTSETSGAGNAGNIKLTASGAVKIDGENSEQDTSSIRSRVRSGSTGNSGTVEITAGSLSVTNGGFINASTQGRGNAGNLSIKVASDLKLDGESIAGEASGIFNEVNSQAVGNAGNIQVAAGSISVLGGAQISSSTAGQGNAGNIMINAGSNFLLDGGGRQGSVSLITSSVNSGAVGNGGNIELTANSVSVKGGTLINSSVAGEGNAGNVKITTLGNIALDGENSLGLGSTIASSVLFGGVGNGGNIELAAGSLSLTNGGNIIAATSGKGKSNAGNVTINVSGDVQLDGETSKGFTTFIGTNVLPNVIGNGGAIKLTAGNLSVSNGAQIGSDTSGQGNAGNITINASGNVQLDGETPQSILSLISSGVNFGAVGTAGNIELTAGSVSLKNGAQINTRTAGQGNAGNVKITVLGNIELDGEGRQGTSSLISSRVNKGAEGTAGNIELTAGSVSLKNGAQINTRTSGQGNAGNVKITALGNVELDGESRQGLGSVISSAAEFEAVGNAGNIQVTTGSMSVLGGAQISSNTSGQGNAGNITINANGNVQLDGEGRQGTVSLISSGVNLGAMGNAGNLELTADSVSLKNGAQINTRTLGQGNAGNVKITAKGNIELDGENRFGLGSFISSAVESGGLGNGGAIELTASNLYLNNGTQIATSNFAEGKGGDITINVSGAVRANGENSQGYTSGIFSNIGINSNTNGVGVGSSGKIDFQAGFLSLTNGAGIAANVLGEGNAGKVSVAVKGDVLLDGSSRGNGSVRPQNGGIYSNVEPDAIGQALGIELTANSLSVSNGAQVTSSALSTGGNAGFVRINTKELLVRDRGRVTVEAANNQNAGDLEVKATNVTIDNGRITAQTESGSRGNINLNIANSLNLRNNSRVSAATVNGEGGRLQVNANSVNMNNSAITTSATGKGGIAGAIDIIGNILQLNDNSRVLATTASGNGGDVILNLADLLLLRRGSSISTTAGQAPGGGDGGNININSRFVVAVPTEKSNISANAYTGRGGNITITTNGIYGFESGAQPSFNRSNITASSALGINGTIIFNIENIDPTRGLTELPSVPTDPSNQIAAGCPAYGDARFVVTGRGGLPDNPKAMRLGQVVLQDFRATTGSIASNRDNKLGIENNRLPIIEAQSLVLDKHGNAELVANIPYNSHSSWNNDIDCQGFRRAAQIAK